MSVNLLQCYLLFLRPVLFQKCNVALLWLVGTELQNGICCSRSGLPQDWELCLRWIRLHHSVTELWLCFIPDDPDCRVSLTSRSGGGKDCSALLGAFFVALLKKKLWGFGFFFFFLVYLFLNGEMNVSLLLCLPRKRNCMRASEAADCFPFVSLWMMASIWIEPNWNVILVRIQNSFNIP